MVRLKGEQFRLMRIQAGLTLKQFAERADVAPSYVCMIERGKRPVTTDVQDKFLNVYGLTKFDVMEAM